MKRRMLVILSLILLVSLWVFSSNLSFATEEAAQGDTVFISGTVIDYHNEPVKEARVKILVNAQPQKIMVEHEEAEETETSSQGTYQLSFTLTPEQIKDAKVQVQIHKTSFAKTTIDLTKDDFAQKGQQFFAVKDIKISPWLGSAFYIATIIFLFIYALISFEVLHRTIAAMLGAAILLLITYTIGTLNPEYHIISFERAMQAIDMNVIFLLMGMMIIVGVLKHTGVFQWCAYISFKLAKGNVMVLSIISMIFIAVTSAFLDNVTTTLLCILATVALIIYNKFFYSKAYAKGKVEDVDKFIALLREQYKITDKTL